MTNPRVNYRNKQYSAHYSTKNKSANTVFIKTFPLQLLHNREESFPYSSCFEMK